MKISERWLREWVNPEISNEELCTQLTMAGLEVESLTPVAEKFSGVVTAQILAIEKHPNADRLNICQVDVGAAEPLTIVCGASNVRVGMKIAAALENALLPNNFKIKLSKIRGVLSNGMLCSANELGLAEESEGLHELPVNAPLGVDVWEYLMLSDNVIDISITPNRGDCLSTLGLATEIAALTKIKILSPDGSPRPSASRPRDDGVATIDDTLTINLTAATECPRYVGRIIRDVKADAVTPIWMQERLRRGGIRHISPVVDVMNYVMLEIGQPMHAFDLNKISGNIHVRMATAAEKIQLLNGQDVSLSANTLLIADDKQPLAIAGVMGGLDSAVTLLTHDLFLESAFFTKESVARTGREYNLSSDSSYRFERGIDPLLQIIAIERATQLLLEIVGGQPGPVIEICKKEYLPQPIIIYLREARVEKILGIKIPAEEIESILKRLDFQCEKTNEGWQVTVPARRSDIVLEIDLIEEVMRLHGYEKLPVHTSFGQLHINARPETNVRLARIREMLCDAGYQEVITYSFIDKKSQQLFDPQITAKELTNPISADMNVMRTNLWPGLVNTFLYNQNRQQSRARLFEVGLRFIPEADGSVLQQSMLSGLASGSVFPEQWASSERAVDFFDIKGDLQNLFSLTLETDGFIFKPAQHPALHPGQTAEIFSKNGDLVGIIGLLHPEVMQTIDIVGNVIVFELFLEKIQAARLPLAQAISKFPEIRRDIAIIVDRAVPALAIQDTIKDVAGDLLREINIFDVYQGKGIAEGRKSVALALFLRHASRTLIDEEVADLVGRVIVTLKDRFAAELRG